MFPTVVIDVCVHDSRKRGEVEYTKLTFTVNEIRAFVLSTETPGRCQTLNLFELQ